MTEIHITKVKGKVSMRLIIIGFVVADKDHRSGSCRKKFADTHRPQ